MGSIFIGGVYVSFSAENTISKSFRMSKIEHFGSRRGGGGGGLIAPPPPPQTPSWIHLASLGVARRRSLCSLRLPHSRLKITAPPKITLRCPCTHREGRLRETPLVRTRLADTERSTSSRNRPEIYRCILFKIK